jgi:hypothetical protein
MDFNGSTSSLQLLGGIDIHGKLILPETNDGPTLSIITTMMIVQGELDMTSMTKPINGRPNVHITLIGQNVNQTFIPIDNNSMACTIGNQKTNISSASCTVGKKAIVVAGGKVNCKYSWFLQNLHLKYCLNSIPLLFCRTHSGKSSGSTWYTIQHQNMDSIV